MTVRELIEEITAVNPNLDSPVTLGIWHDGSFIRRQATATTYEGDEGGILIESFESAEVKL